MSRRISVGHVLALVAVAVLSICGSASAQGVPVISSVTADRAFPVSSTSAPIRWTANVAGSSDGLQFRFWHYSSRINQWQLGRDWSTDNTWLFHPSPLYEGRNLIQAGVRRGFPPPPPEGDGEASRNSDDFELGPPAPGADWTPTYLAVSDPGIIPTYYDLNNSEFTFSSSGRTISVTVLHFSSHRLFSFDFTFPTDALIPGTYPGGPSGTFTVHSIEPPGATAGSLAVDFGSTQLRIRALVPLSIGEVTVSHVTPIAPYTQVFFTVDARASEVPLEYRFMRRAPDGTSHIRECSHSKTLEWSLLPGDQGTHTMTVWIRRQGSAEVFEWVREAPPLLINWSPAEMVSLTADRSFPARAGSKIRWTATARGGSSTLLFKFWVYSFRTGQWTVGRPWHYFNTWEWQSTPLDEGPHVVQVWVSSSGVASSGVVEPQSFLSSDRFDLTSPTGAWMLLRRRSVGAFEQVFVSGENSVYSPTVTCAGVVVTLGETPCAATSVFADFRNPANLPHGSLLLQMPSDRVLAPGLYETGWSVLSPYLGRMAITGLSTVCAPGSGTFRILEVDYTSDGVLRKLAADAHQPCGSGAYAYTESAAIRVNSTLPLFNFLSLTSNVGAAIAPRTRVEWRAAASSGTGGVEYKFWLYRAASQSWTLLQDWSTDDTSDWTPSSADTGRFYLQAWARTIGSGANYDDWRQSDPLDVAPGPPRVHAIETEPEPRSGQGTTLRVTAGGGSTDFEYRFWAYDRSTGAWTMLRDYSPDATFVWNTNPTQRGQYTIQVWARETGTTGEPQAWLAQDLELFPARLVLFRGDSAAEHQTGGQLFSYTTQTATFSWYGRTGTPENSTCRLSRSARHRGGRSAFGTCRFLAATRPRP